MKTINDNKIMIMVKLSVHLESFFELLQSRLAKISRKKLEISKVTIISKQMA